MAISPDASPLCPRVADPVTFLLLLPISEILAKGATGEECIRIYVAVT